MIASCTHFVISSAWGGRLAAMTAPRVAHYWRSTGCSYYPGRLEWHGPEGCSRRSWGHLLSWVRHCYGNWRDFHDYYQKRPQQRKEACPNCSSTSGAGCWFERSWASSGACGAPGLRLSRFATPSCSLGPTATTPAAASASTSWKPQRHPSCTCDSPVPCAYSWLGRKTDYCYSYSSCDSCSFRHLGLAPGRRRHLEITWQWFRNYFDFVDAYCSDN